ncbi:MAG: DUF6249 domain-containing protein [Vicinamibacterales bacterium]
MSNPEIFFFVLPITLVVGGFAIVLLGIWKQTRIKELEHRERLALIERGLVPPSAPDPSPAAALLGRHGATPRRARLLSGGIVVIGFGLALMMVIGFAGGAPDVAMGIGGAVVVLGASFVVNAIVTGRLEAPAAPPADPAPPVPPMPPEA